MNTAPNKADKSLIRAEAAYLRKGDNKLTPLQAIVKLQELRDQFRDQWTGSSPWLVLPDLYALPVEMPVPRMLKEIEKHGEPVGIAGVAMLTTRQFRVFRMPFLNDTKSRDTVERSAREAERLAQAALKAKIDPMIEELLRSSALQDIHKGAKDDRR